jgi:hypothetical protein
MLHTLIKSVVAMGTELAGERRAPGLRCVLIGKGRCITILVLLSLLLLPGCARQAEFDKVYTVVTAATLQPGAMIPQPKEEVILTVNGKIGATTGDGIIAMDRSAIEGVGVVEYSVQDPFENREIVYRGVLMRDLLKLWQVAEDVKTIRLIALNDYQIDIPIEDFYQYPVLYAMQADGVYMEPDYQGPAMLVYPIDDYKFDLITIKRRWIWQIKQIIAE